MADKAIKNLARLQAVRGATHEVALSRALENESTAAEAVDRARTARQKAEAAHAKTQSALLETGRIMAEDLLHRAEDFARSRTDLLSSQERETQEQGALLDAKAAVREKRRDWAQSKSRERALEKKLRAAQKQNQDRRENRDDG